MTEVHIRPLDKTPYYLIRNEEKYIYRSLDGDDGRNEEKYIYRSLDGDDGKAPEIDVSRCEVKFGSEEPSVAMQSTTITRRMEWLFYTATRRNKKKKF